MDREIMDMLMGEPTVAKMRACMGKVSPLAGARQFCERGAHRHRKRGASRLVAGS